ncbi:hypothetical protein [Vagococcus salmoninarum]|uniref:hypothetical protein n=1 Tax=Vagococcus salmoninarum TaxID=2739 RepID=UPI00187E053F|nr:hypothetical protein [Vagococcus salmoninarum]MBE9389907.1 hypothetical protein [Vagococcus salmoninarum]
MENVASNTSSASSAITGVTNTSVSRGQQVTLGKSNIASMKTGMSVNNQVMTNLAEMVNCVQGQSQKFPKIAELIAIRDSQVTF